MQLRYQNEILQQFKHVVVIVTIQDEYITVYIKIYK